MKMEDITAGESYACHFRVETFVDEDSNPVDTRNLQVGQAVKGKPGMYEGFGVITVRDIENKLVEIKDLKTHKLWAVHWDNCWDIDSVEWVDE